ncbi:TetR family transcriptional regulator [Aeromicrobium flavum]|uniref:TetR family transcriptional regulator n=1 Tax=Aeromicrobium flavum TaxID=416568 RepID=A0A512HV35_9ACTN|nr:TetR/AcrR family transcriptional regulator [Aeromicrobium flavum]GEO89270.1 TetR family transcriptional regulator [Aeromicrobium flavum]
MPPKSAEESKRRLVEAAIAVMTTEGINAMSARSVSQRAGLAQGLVFYHFGSVTDLVAQACVTATRERVELHRERFEQAGSFGELVQLARDVQESERGAGHVSVLGQALVMAQGDPGIGRAAREALLLWREPLGGVASRLLAKGSPFGGAIDAEAFTDLLMAAFIGFELTDPVRTEADSDRAYDAVASMATALDGLGPVARRAVAATLRRRR